MIVYGDRRRARDPRPWLRDIAGQAADVRAHSGIRDLLVEFDRFEVALADALSPEADGVHPVAELAGAAAMALGRALVESWWHSGAEAARWLGRFRAALRALAAAPLPDSASHGVAEGYAYYALFPECYAEAALAAFRAERPSKALVVGLRGIGASLSAVVAGALEAAGCPARRFTLRPRGHPFARRPILAPELDTALRGATDGALALIVDEGPGLSGSSLTGTAALLSELGVADERIVLLPSWDACGADFRSAAARARWDRHRRYIAAFEDVWPARTLGPRDALTELSGGAWRAEIFAAPPWPAVQPQHERRKYRRDGTAGLIVFRFAGLGEVGRRKQAVAERLAEAGWSPPPRGLADGFLAQDWVAGRPLRRADAPAVLPHLAAYAAFRRTAFPLSDPVPLDSLLAMAGEALEEAFGPAARRVLDRCDRAPLLDAPVVAVDGRMLPHEWLAIADERFVKTDALDHHDDHFFPGPQDAAWDLASAAIEFGLGPEAQASLTEIYAARAGDPAVALRLPFYRLAYAAWRLGYADLAAGSLAGAPDGRRFRRLAARYRRALAAEIPALAEALPLFGRNAHFR